MSINPGRITRDDIASYLRKQGVFPRSETELDVWMNNGKWQYQYNECVLNNYDLMDFDRWQYLQKVLNTELPFKTAMSISSELAKVGREVLDIPHDSDTLWNTDAVGQQVLDTAKDRVCEFIEKMGHVPVNFDDMSRVELARNAFETEGQLHGIVACVDFDRFAIDQYIDGSRVASREFSSLAELSDEGLAHLSLGQLTAVSPGLLEEFSLQAKLQKGIATEADIEKMMAGSDFLREELAARGINLDTLVHDESWSVRLAVAQQGREQDLAVLVNDPDWIVRLGVAEMEYGLDQLVNDKNYEVRTVAREVYERGGRSLRQGLDAQIGVAEAQKVAPASETKGRDEQIR